MVDDTSLRSFFAAWDLFADAMVASTAAGLLLGFLGVYVVLRRMVFFSAALSQAAGLGVTLGLYAQVYWSVSAAGNPAALGAAGITLAVAWLVVHCHARAPSQSDGILGVVYLVGSAGTLVLATRVVHELRDVETLLFGSAVAVLPGESTWIVAMGGVLVAIHMGGVRGFVQASFDPEGAQIRGLPVKALNLVLLGSLALAISVCTRVLGALPVFAFSVLPALAALRLAHNVRCALLLAACFGALSGAGGYIAAFCWKLPVGAAQTLLGAACLLLTLLWRRLRHG